MERKRLPEESGEDSTEKRFCFFLFFYFINLKPAFIAKFVIRVVSLTLEGDSQLHGL